MVLRLSGLASGMDIDQMVSELMGTPHAGGQELSTKAGSRMAEEDYRTINTKLLTLRNSAFDMRLQGTYMSKSASSSNNDVLGHRREYGIGRRLHRNA